MATTIPQVPNFTGEIAQRTDPTTFAERADPQYAYQAQLSVDLNTTVDAINIVSSEVEASAAEAEQAAETASSSANFIGRWDEATGAATKGSVYYHNGQNWQLLDDVADITASEPSNSNSEWLGLASGKNQVSTSDDSIQLTQTGAELQTILNDSASVLKAASLATGCELEQIMLATDTTTSLDDILYIYDAANQITYAKPSDVGTGEVIVGVESGVLTTDATTYQLITAKISTAIEASSYYGLVSGTPSNDGSAAQRAGQVWSTGSTKWRIAETGAVLLDSGLYATPLNTLMLNDFGVILNDRTEASNNDSKLADFMAIAEMDNVTAAFYGNVFITEWVIDGTVKIKGYGNTAWPTNNASRRSQSTDEILQSSSQITVTGVGSRNKTIEGVSSMRASGGVVANGSARAGYNESEYSLLSFVEESETVARTFKPFSVAVHVKDSARNSSLSGFRIVLDSGGIDGLDGYFGEYEATEPWCSGYSDYDIGLWVDIAISLKLTDVQIVGPWKMAGRLITTIQSNYSGLGYTFPSQPYDSVYTNCIFEGYKASSIRGYDEHQIVSVTTTTVDIVWADDHPYKETGSIYLGQNQYGRTEFEYTSTEKVSGSPDLLRFNVVDDPTVSFSAGNNITPGTKGGSSGMLDDHCRYGGMGHPSGYQCQYQGLLEPMDYPGGGEEISGFKLTEITRKDWIIQHVEQIGHHLHSVREVYYDESGQAEGNTATGATEHGLRFIASPYFSENTRVDYASGHTFNCYYGCSDMMIGDANDFGPYIASYDRGLFSGDDGLFWPNYIRVPQYALRSDLTQGTGTRCPVGGKTGFITDAGFSSGNQSPISNEEAYALAYDDNLNKIVQYKDYAPNANNTQNIGQDGKRFASIGTYSIDGASGSGVGISLDGIDHWRVSATALRPDSNGVYDLGRASTRVLGLYIVNSPDVSSDATLKEQRGELTVSELSAAKRIARLPRIFQWLSEQETKKDTDGIVYYHCSPMVQDIIAVFEDEGVDCTQYGFVNDGGNDGTMSIQPQELLWMICASQQGQLDDFESRLEALEK